MFCSAQRDGIIIPSLWFGVFKFGLGLKQLASFNTSGCQLCCLVVSHLAYLWNIVDR